MKPKEPRQSKKSASDTTRSTREQKGRPRRRSPKKVLPKAYSLTGQLTIAIERCTPVVGEGTINTPLTVIDSNGNEIQKTMVEVEIAGERQLVCLDAEQVAVILMAMRIIPYGDF